MKCRIITWYIPDGGPIFLLSPASCSGKRAGLVFNPKARFEVAQRLRSPEGAPVGDVFTFLSGLYFRGKLAYARRYARPPEGTPGVLIITAGAGLVEAEEPVTLRHLERFARVPIDAGEQRYRRPLARRAQPGGARGRMRGRAARLDRERQVRGHPGKIFGERLLFPRISWAAET